MEDAYRQHDAEHVDCAERDRLDAEQPDQRARPGSVAVRSASRVSAAKPAAAPAITAKTAPTPPVPISTPAGARR
jgi:hypothetical protein